ncbi:ATP-dependent DNA ligase [Streptomyces sp. NBC_00316]|uniref:ATP-dependent DNA ligase n=1 Tax=Streptomyces sp. NBC_00316 TaxID=2975710 RepID=UPI002E2E6D8C|nr:DNA ligase [Streptomyces sp. NBC_00316]
MALAYPVPTVPHGPGWWYEPKFDGHRTVMARTEDTVTLYARSGRVVTTHWMDLATAGMTALLRGTVLDGEAVVWRDGRIDFGAAQSRAASSLMRARQLAAQYPASYVVWDVLQHPVHGAVARRPYTERRALLLDLLADVDPPIQAAPATDDYETAEHWYRALQAQGIEGIVAKRAEGGYPFGRRGWVKVRHADTINAQVVGHTGPRHRPRNLAVVAAGENRVRLTARLTAGLAAHIGQVLADAPEAGAGRADQEIYTRLDTGLVVEVLAGSGRHGTLTVTRMR